MSSSLQIGEIYKVRIERSLPIGLLVSLSDGRHGIVRKREITWSGQDAEQWQTRYQQGDIYDAVLLKDKKDGLELSLRLAVHDPWIHVEQDYQIGSWVRGIVTGLDESGVFVELEPGVIAKLHQSQLPDWNRQEFSDLFWPGDHVWAEVVDVNSTQREISLSLRNILTRRWNAQELPLFHSHLSQNVNGAKAAQGEPELPLAILTEQGVYKILVVEDDPQQRQVIVMKLLRAGHELQGVDSAEEAIRFLSQEAFDIVLSDVGLPQMDGIDLIGQVVQNYPQTRAFLMTDWVTADQRQSAIALLEEQGVRLLLKPLTPEDILLIFNKDKTSAVFTAERDIEGSQPLSGFRGQQIAVHKRLRQVLEEFRVLTQATQAVIFTLHPDRRHIEVLENCGRSTLNQQAINHLLYSPVRDAIEDQLLVQVQDSQQMTVYTRYLLPLLSFRSCLGAPIPGNSQGRFALFLFFSRPNAYDKNTEKMLQAGALTLGALLNEQATLERMTEMQRTLLVGHLTRALVHEANHQLSPILFALEDLQSQCGRVERSIGGPISDALAEMQETRVALKNLSLSLQNLMRTTKMFGRITVQDEVRMVRIDLVLNRCMALLQDMADRAHVTIEHDPPSQIMVTKARETLIQQILLNLLLNAVQQIALTRPSSGGRVRVSIHKQMVEQQSVIQISVEDDGPGIHCNQWRRIFDLGMTTRKTEGSGLGLYLVKQLCAEIQGCAYIAESAILWGSHFVVEIPVNL